MLDHFTLIAAAALATCASAQLHVPGTHADIRSAIAAAKPGQTVIVADGVYRGFGNRDLDFAGKNILVRSANGPAHCIIDCQGTETDAHRGFLFENGETRESIVDGFTIVNGQTEQGAILDPFNGGAIRIRNASPVIRNCVLRDNVAACWGGAIYAGFGGAPLILNCYFENNTADDGGAFFSWQGAATEIRSSVFIRNTVSNAGAAIAEFGGGTLHIKNSTIVQNVAATWSVGGIADFGGGASTIESSIVWGNTGSAGSAQISVGSLAVVRFCDVQGGHAGEGNMNAAPRFLPDGYRLRASSPCINAAAPGYAPWPGETDIDGERRIQQGRVDIGADETRAGVILPGLGDLLGSLGGGIRR